LYLVAFGCPESAIAAFAAAIQPTSTGVNMTISDDKPVLEASFLDPVVQDDPFDVYAEMHEKCPVYRLP